MRLAACSETPSSRSRPLRFSKPQDGTDFGVLADGSAGSVMTGLYMGEEESGCLTTETADLGTTAGSATGVLSELLMPSPVEFSLNTVESWQMVGTDTFPPPFTTAGKHLSPEHTDPETS